MPVTVNVMLGWCRVAQASRAALATNLMPGGLIELADFMPEEVKDAAKSFARQPIDAFVIFPHTMNYRCMTLLPSTDINFLDVFKSNWANTEAIPNERATDFNLYSTYKDAKEEKYPWEFCTYNSATVGFPSRIVGPPWIILLVANGTPTV